MTSLQKENQALTILKYINLYALLVFFIFASISITKHAYKAWPMGIYFGSWVLLFIGQKLWKQYCFQKKHLLLFAVLLFYLLGYLFYPIDDAPDLVFWRQKDRIQLAIFAFPLLFPLNDKIKLAAILKAVLAGSVISILYIYALLETDITSITALYKTYFHGTHSFYNHNPYNLYLNLGVVACYILGKNSFYSKRYKSLAFYLLTSLFIGLAIYLSEGRTGYITYIGITGLFILYLIGRRRKVLAIITLLIFTSIAAWGYVNQFSHRRHLRKEIWAASIATIEKKPILGYGLGGAKEAIFPEYKKRGMKSSIENKYYSHNVLLQSWLCYGIIGFLTMFVILFSPFILRTSNNRLLNWLVSIVFLFSAMLECYFWMGIGTICYVTVLTILFKDSETPNGILKIS